MGNGTLLVSNTMSMDANVSSVLSQWASRAAIANGAITEIGVAELVLNPPCRCVRGHRLWAFEFKVELMEGIDLP